MDTELLLVLAVSVGILIVPVKFLALAFRTRNMGLFACSIAIVLAVVTQTVGMSFFPFRETHVALEYSASFIVASFVYMVSLGTTYSKGLIFGLMQLTLMFVVISVIDFLIGMEWIPFSI